MKRITRTLVLVSAIASAACASKPRTVELGRDHNNAIDGTNFEAILPGHARIDLHPNAPAYLCVGNRAESFPQVAITDAEGNKMQGRVTCTERGKQVTVDFPRVLKVGKYKVNVSTPRSMGPNVKGTVRFQPLEADKNSGPNRIFQGATDLKMGVNEGQLAPSLGNRTDWWKIEVPSLTSASMAFQVDVEASEAKANVFRMAAGRLQRTAVLTSGHPRNVRLEGTYYVSVVGAEFGKSLKYSLALAKMESAASNALARAASTENIPIMDLWPITPARTAIVLGAGTGRGIKSGDVIKVFSSNNALLDGCVVGGVSERESECTIERSIKDRDAVRARRSL